MIPPLVSLVVAAEVEPKLVEISVSALTAIIVAVVAATPPLLAVLRNRRNTTLQHEDQNARLDRIEGKIEMLIDMHSGIERRVSRIENFVEDVCHAMHNLPPAGP